MSNILDPIELSGYLAKRTDSELLEDLSHLFELNIVTNALAATDFGRRYKVPLNLVTNMNAALKVYRDELLKRSTDSDKLNDTAYTLLGEYYRCVKVVRSLSKYINKILPELESDFSNSYTKLYEHKASTDFKSSAVEN